MMFPLVDPSSILWSLPQALHWLPGPLHLPYPQWVVVGGDVLVVGGDDDVAVVVNGFVGVVVVSVAVVDDDDGCSDGDWGASRDGGN